MNSAFPDNDTRNRFWDELSELLDRYPSIVEGFIEACKENADVDDLVPFDEFSPVVRNGIVLIMAFRNLDNHESLLTLDPMQQSEYMTQGMLSVAADS
jgi:hypothetical protein